MQPPTKQSKKEEWTPHGESLGDLNRLGQFVRQVIYGFLDIRELYRVMLSSSSLWKGEVKNVYRALAAHRFTNKDRDMFIDRPFRNTFLKPFRDMITSLTFDIELESRSTGILMSDADWQALFNLPGLQSLTITTPFVVDDRMLQYMEENKNRLLVFRARSMNIRTIDDATGIMTALQNIEVLDIPIWAADLDLVPINMPRLTSLRLHVFIVRLDEDDEEDEAYIADESVIMLATGCPLLQSLVLHQDKYPDVMRPFAPETIDVLHRLPVLRLCEVTARGLLFLLLQYGADKKMGPEKVALRVDYDNLASLHMTLHMLAISNRLASLHLSGVRDFTQLTTHALWPETDREQKRLLEFESLYFRVDTDIVRLLPNVYWQIADQTRQEVGFDYHSWQTVILNRSQTGMWSLQSSCNSEVSPPPLDPLLIGFPPPDEKQPLRGDTIPWPLLQSCTIVGEAVLFDKEWFKSLITNAHRSRLQVLNVNAQQWNAEFPKRDRHNEPVVIDVHPLPLGSLFTEIEWHEFALSFPIVFKYENELFERIGRARQLKRLTLCLDRILPADLQALRGLEVLRLTTWNDDEKQVAASAADLHSLCANNPDLLELMLLHIPVDVHPTAGYPFALSKLEKLWFTTTSHTIDLAEFEILLNGCPRLGTLIIVLGAYLQPAPLASSESSLLMLGDVPQLALHAPIWTRIAQLRLAIRAEHDSVWEYDTRKIYTYKYATHAASYNQIAYMTAPWKYVGGAEKEEKSFIVPKLATVSDLAVFETLFTTQGVSEIVTLGSTAVHILDEHEVPDEKWATIQTQYIRTHRWTIHPYYLDTNLLATTCYVLDNHRKIMFLLRWNDFGPKKASLPGWWWQKSLPPVKDYKGEVVDMPPLYFKHGVGRNTRSSICLLVLDPMPHTEPRSQFTAHHV
jgi:hypothetical protein